MSGPYCGKQVKIHGLLSKPELNGIVGTATTYDDSKSRYNVKLPSGGAIALQPKNLEPVSDCDGGASGGGMPGRMGGMPGMGGIPGMGGMPDIAQMLPQLLAQAGLPPNTEPAHLGAAGLALGYLIFYSGWTLRGLVGAVLLLAFFLHRPVFHGAGGKMRGCVAVVSTVVGKLVRKASAISGRPVAVIHVLGALAALLFAFSLVLDRLLGSRARTAGSNGAGELDDVEFAIQAAYNSGFDDAAAGKKRDVHFYISNTPSSVSHAAPGSAAAGASGGSGGMGIGSMMNMFIVGSMVYRMGGSPWSLGVAIANARANPMQLVMAAMMCSRMF